MGCSSSNQRSLISNQATLRILCIPAATAQTPFRPHLRSSVATRVQGGRPSAPREVKGHVALEASWEHCVVAAGQAAPTSSSCSITVWPQMLPAFLGLDASFLGWVI